MQTCRVCRHEKRQEIDEALLTGDPFRHVASRYGGMSTTALQRHKRTHLPVTLTKAKEAREELQADTLFERLRSINRASAAILQEARRSKSPGLALAAIARIEKQIELEGKLLGQLDESVKVAVGFDIVKPPEPVYDLDAVTEEELQTAIRIWRKVRGEN